MHKGSIWTIRFSYDARFLPRVGEVGLSVGWPGRRGWAGSGSIGAMKAGCGPVGVGVRRWWSADALCGDWSGVWSWVVVKSLIYRCKV